MSLQNFSLKKQELSKLLDQKIEMIHTLINTEKELANTIIPDDSDNSNWISGFPIESIKQLVPTNKLKTRLGDFKIRSNLKKSCSKILDELDCLDNKIKISLLDLMIAKTNLVLERQQNV